MNLNGQNSKQTPKGFSVSGPKVNSQKESRKKTRLVIKATLPKGDKEKGNRESFQKVNIPVTPHLKI